MYLSFLGSIHSLSISKLADNLRTHGQSDVISKDYFKSEINTNMTHLEQSKKVHETNNIEPAFKRNRRITFNIGSQNINGIGGKIINHYPNGTITVIIKQDISPAEKAKLNQSAQSVLQSIKSAFRGPESKFKYALPIIQNEQTAFLDAQSELENAQSELENAQSELKDAQSELEDAQSEFKDAQSEFKDAQSEFKDAQSVF
jgi:hypothetical protein